MRGNVRGILTALAAGVLCGRSAAGSGLSLIPEKTFFMQGAPVDMRVTLSGAGDLTGKRLRLTILSESGREAGTRDVAPLVFVNAVRFEGLPCGKYTVRTELFADRAASGGSETRTLNAHVLDETREVSAEAWIRVIPQPERKPRARIRDGVLFADDEPFLMLSTGLTLSFEERKRSAAEQRRLLDERLAELAEHGFNLVCPGDLVFSGDYLAYPDIAEIYGKTAGWGVRERVALMPHDRVGYSEFIALAKKHGLFVKGWVSPVTRTRELTPRQIEIWSDLVLKYRNEENILFWKTEDETDTWPEHNALLYRLFKEIDPARPVKLVVINAVQPNLGAADIHSTDPYPLGDGNSIGAVAYHCDRLKRLTGGNPGQCFVLWLQMYGHKHEKKICPTPRQLRAMAFLALNHGAKGLLYHTYQPKGQRNKNDWELTDELFASTKTLHAQIRTLSAPYLLGKALPDVSADNPAVDVAAREHGGVVYVIAVNTSMRPLPLVRITLPGGKWPKQADQLFDNRQADIRGGTIEAALNVNGVRVYAVRPAGEGQK